MVYKDISSCHTYVSVCDLGGVQVSVCSYVYTLTSL